MLKLLARFNSLYWSGSCGCGHSGRISLHHIFFECPSVKFARSNRETRLFNTFHSHSRQQNPFNWEAYSAADPYLKLQIYLGKRSGDPVLDKKIDTIVRLFLKAILPTLSE